MRMKMVCDDRTLREISNEFLALKKAQKIRDRTLSDYRKYIDKFLAQSENSLDVEILKTEILDFFAEIPKTSPARFNHPYQYSDICRYLGVTRQNNNRQTLRAAVESLAAAGFISHESRGRTQILKVLPKATEIPLPRAWVQSVIRHDYSSESVAFAQVLKVFAWIVWNKAAVVTNDLIAMDLNVSASTVVSAKNVLKREYENVRQRNVSEKLGDNFFRNLGQELEANAWWTAI